jgi:LytS/YehU family sensor histidine kinase
MGTTLVVSALAMPVALPLAFAVGELVAHALGRHVESATFRSYRIGLAFGLVFMTLFFFRRSRAEAREAALSAEARIRELENKRLEAQLAALTAEMNPHLLFNALNTVAALIPESPARAEEVVLQLAALYRGVLASSRKATHPLGDELGLCRAYLDVERARFGDRLDVRLDVDEDVDVRAIEVPVLLLQPFVENAVKHGLSQRARGGSVRLSVRAAADSLESIVEDDGVGLGASTSAGAGTAIANCRARLALTYGGRARLDVEPRAGGGTRVTVTIPLRAVA